MTRPATSEIRDYIKDLRDKMRLDAWDLTISEDPPKAEGAWAEIDPTDGRWHAAIRFRDDFFDEDAEEQRANCVHELLHLTHYEAQEIIRNGEYRHQLGQALYDHVVGEFKHALERMTDFNARLVARSLPFPPWCPPESE